MSDSTPTSICLDWNKGSTVEKRSSTGPIRFEIDALVGYHRSFIINFVSYSPMPHLDTHLHVQFLH